jgi:hypothetical protein
LLKYLESGQAAEWDRQLELAYKKLQEYIRRASDPVYRGYAETIRDLAAEEIGGTAPDIEETVVQYQDAMVKRYTGGGKGQIETVVRESAGKPGVEVVAAVEDRLDHWLETRADKVGLRESVTAGAVFAKATWAALGVAGLIWVSVGKSCPLCTEMDGRRIRTGDTFARGGDVIDPEDGKTSPLTVDGDVGHPQLHDGCDCMVAPG